MYLLQYCNNFLYNLEHIILTSSCDNKMQSGMQFFSISVCDECMENFAISPLGPRHFSNVRSLDIVDQFDIQDCTFKQAIP